MTSIDAPSEFMCCLTLDLLEDPVATPRGFVFERSAIVDWLSRGEKTCPLSREPLEDFELVDNTELLEKISAWKKAHGILEVTKKCHEKSKPSPRRSNQMFVSPNVMLVRERILKQRQLQIQAHMSRC